MQTTTTTYNNNITAPIRTVNAKVELYLGSTLVNTYYDNTNIISIEIQRVAEDSKFFGIGVCQRLSLKLIDTSRGISLTTSNYFKVYIGTNNEFMTFPYFYITEVNRDEETNQLSITAYDLIDKSNAYTFSDLNMTAPYTLLQVAQAIATKIGVTLDTPSESVWSTSYPLGANLDGTEVCRSLLTQLAEVTQTIYYIGYDNELHFKRYNQTTTALTINKAEQISIDSGDNKRLQTIMSQTELGDNVHESTSLTGSTQYVRENAFWVLRDDLATLIHNAITAVGNMTINIFNCTWRGNPALEIGDRIALITKNNNTVYSYVTNDVITFDGGLSEVTQWSYSTENETETDSNPTSLGEILNQTYARVDKANKNITLLASAVTEIEEDVEKTVKQVDVEYYLSTSSTEPIGGTWSTTAPTWESGKYMWSRQKVTYVDGTTATRNATCIQGAKGEDGESGEDGRGITSLVSQYYLSDSSTTTTGGSWSDTQPSEIPTSKYVWTRTKINYDDGTTGYTTEVCNVEYEAIKNTKEQVASINLNIDNITSRVTATESVANNASDDIISLRNDFAEQNNLNSESFTSLTNEVTQKITATEAQTLITEALSDGVNTVTTTTGFTFDKDGLTISKTGSDIENTIDETGMYVKENGNVVLSANNEGVDAKNLHATTYLIIGTYSRFEDWNGTTACFWLGGN